MAQDGQKEGRRERRRKCDERIERARGEKKTLPSPYVIRAEIKTLTFIVGRNVRTGGGSEETEVVDNGTAKRSRGNRGNDFATADRR